MILDSGESGATAKFQSQVFKVAMFCVRQRGEEEDAVEEELNPARVRLLLSGSGLGNELRSFEVESEMEADRDDGNSTWSTGIPLSGCRPRPEMIPVPDSPPLSAQLPTQQPSKTNLRSLDSSIYRTCEPSQVPRADGTQYEKLSRGQLHDQCSH